MDIRHNSRILILQTLFRKDFNLEKIDDNLFIKELCEINSLNEFDNNLFQRIIKSIKKNLKAIDKIISKYAPERPIDQIFLIDKEILRIAIAESYFEKITPKKVAINEAIELAKKFGNENSSKFVNGVLGSLFEQNKND